MYRTLRVAPVDASLGMLWHKLSELPVVTIAKIRGRARGTGSELALACDMRFAAAESAGLGQIEAGVASFPADGVLTAKRVLNELTMPAADAFRADAVRFRQLVAADAAQARTAALFAQGCRPAARSNSTSATASEPSYTTARR